MFLKTQLLRFSFVHRLSSIVPEGCVGRELFRGNSDLRFDTVGGVGGALSVDNDASRRD